jgi:hypothetical protein
MGTLIRSASHLAAAMVVDDVIDDDALTFVIDANGSLRVAPRRSEHVACAGGEDVLSAGELAATRSGARVVDISNQSTGYCPEPSSYDVVATALDAAGIAHPGAFTFEAIFRRCPTCSERNLIKDGDFTCAICGGVLPERWNF